MDRFNFFISHLRTLLLSAGFALPLSALATDVVVADANGNQLTYSYDTADGPATFKSVKSYAADADKAGHIIIADAVTDGDGNTHEVKYISGSVGNRANLVSIVFGQNIVATGGPDGQSDDAFYNCDKLESVTLNAKLEILGRYTFQSCNSLTSINLEDATSLTTIRYKAFESVPLTTLTIPTRVETIESGVFTNCDALKSFVLSAGVTTLGDGVWENCDSLRTFTFADGSPLTAIPNSTFASCPQLERLKIPNTVKSIGTGAFYNDRSLKEIEFGTDLESFATDGVIFYNCPIEKMVLPGVNYPFKGDSPTNYLNQYAVLYVHPDMVETYRTTNYTKRFRIMAIGSTTDFAVTTTAGGQLQSKMPEDVAQYALKLTVSGPLNGTDIDYLHSAFPIVEELNLRDARIVSGGDPYYEWWYDNPSTIRHYNETKYYTEDNVVGTVMFYNMPSLKRIVVPSGVTKIGDWAFSQQNNDRYNLQQIDIPAGITEIGKNAFRRTAITTFTVPAAVKRLEEYAFYECNKLQTVSLPDGITYIGYSCFSECLELVSVNMPTSIETLANYAFYNNRKRTTPLTFSASLRTIGNYAFQNNYLLPSVTFSNGLESVGHSAFNSCHLIEAADLPESVTFLGNGAFYHCDSLRQFTFPQNIKVVPSDIMGQCVSLERVTLAEGTTSINWYAFANCKKLSQVNLAEQTSLTYIDTNAFSYTALKNVTLPNTITSMGSSAFRECPELESINVPTGMDYVPYDFVWGCPKLTSVTMHDGIRRVGHNAFGRCTSLATIDLNDQITDIEYSAFYNCSSLQLEKLPDALTHIGSQAFYGTTSMSGTLTIPAGVTAIDGEAFRGSGIEGMVMHSGITSLGNNLLYNCTSLKHVTLPDNITSIPNYMFYNCSALEQIDLPQTVTEIRYAAFYRSGLTSIELPENLNYLGDYAFEQTQLRTFRMPDGFTTGYFGTYVLQNCKHLKTVHMGRNQDYSTFTSFTTFNGCDSLELLRLYAGTPPSANSYYFGFRSKCVLEVPDDPNIIAAYQEVEPWKSFKEIRGFFSGDELREQDFAVMQSLYEKFGGGSWSQPWNMENNHHAANKWAGVSTEQIGTTTQFAITALDLSSLGLSGELPEEVFRLKNLKTLNLSRNHLSGNLGEVLGRIVSMAPLTDVNLQGNELSGDLVDLTSRMPDLQKLNMGYNQLTDVSTVIDRTTLTDLNLEMQFIDWHTKQPVAAAADVAQDITAGVPTAIELPTTFTYRHNNQDFGRNPSNLYRPYCTNISSNYWSNTYELTKSGGLWNIDAYDTRMLRAPKDQPVAYAMDWQTVILRFTWEDGDVNADQTVDVTDLQNVIYFALNERKAHGQIFNYTAADDNQDGSINVIDIVGNVEYILNYSQPASGARAYNNNIYGSAQNELLLNDDGLLLHNTDEVAALQLTVSGVSQRDLRLASAVSSRFSVSMRPVADGVRIVVYSPVGNVLAPGNHQLFAQLPAGAAITDVCLSDKEAHRLGVMVNGDVTTGIDQLVQSLGDDAPVYDLSGRPAGSWQSLPAGVYVVRINGKQYKVKK